VNVRIEYNLAYPSLGWTPIATSAANTGSYRWIVPPGISSATRVRVISVAYNTVGDTSNANFTLDARSIYVSAPLIGVQWLAGDVDTIRWTSQNLSENVKIEINRSFPSTTWTTLAASIPNTGSWAWTVTGPASSVPRIRIRGVTHTAICDTSHAFTLAVRSIAIGSPNTALTWIVGDSSGVRWSTANLFENVRVELKRVYPSGTWETLAASVPWSGSLDFVVTGPTSTTARVRVIALTHTFVGDTSNVNFIIGQRSLHVTSPNTATTRLIGGVDTIRWTSACMSSEYVHIQINRSFPSGSWSDLAAYAPNTGSYLWLVNGPATTNARVRIMGLVHTSVGDTSDADISLAVPQLAVTTPNGGENWFVGDADTIRWTSQNLTENVKIEVNRAFPTGTWTALASAAPNTGWFRWVVTSGNSTSARIRISAVSHTFVRDSSASAFTIAARSITVTSPATAVTWLVGDTATIRWSSLNLPDDSVKIEINRAYSTGTWSVIAARVPNNGVYSWIVTGPNSTAARIRVSGTVHTTTTGISAVNFTIGTRRITVTAPNTAVIWTAGTTQSITWTTAYLSDSMRIELNRTYPGGSWETIASGVPNTHTYSWTVSGAATTTARIRIRGYSNPAIGDTSNVNFTIRVPGSPQLSAEDGQSVPTEFRLAQNYPNPFNATTQIEYDLPQPTHVQLRVFDMLGHEVITLTDALQPAGRFRVSWNGRDKEGRFAGSGVFFYQIKAGHYSGTEKLILLK
jgi:hypothetical protein